MPAMGHAGQHAYGWASERDIRHQTIARRGQRQDIKVAFVGAAKVGLTVTTDRCHGKDQSPGLLVTVQIGKCHAVPRKVAISDEGGNTSRFYCACRCRGQAQRQETYGCPHSPLLHTPSPDKCRALTSICAPFCNSPISGSSSATVANEPVRHPARWLQMPATVPSRLDCVARHHLRDGGRLSPAPRQRSVATDVKGLGERGQRLPRLLFCPPIVVVP